MSLRLLPVVLFAGLALSSCASMSEEECQYQDWEARGRQDGTYGERVDRFGGYTKTCGRYGVQPDYNAYMRGREAGLALFCTPQGVYAAGLLGRGNVGECRAASFELVRIHTVTMEYFGAERDLQAIRSSYDSLFSRRRYARNQIRDIRRDLRKKDLSQKDRDELEDRLDRRRDDIDRYAVQELDLRFRLRDAEFRFDDAREELLRLEYDLGLRGGRVTGRVG